MTLKCDGWALVGNSDEGKLRVVVTYCSGRVGLKHFKGLRAFLNKQPFADRVTIIGERGQDSASNFEVHVEVEKKKDLIHSESTGGFPTSGAIKQAIADKINLALIEMDNNNKKKKGATKKR
eukprot:CAMPEP_0194049354 /NCGR_PEP_ID=MMETSP0009_2-20130614/30492_1 /TAXON_ID=210454 /ORGANISM="Grammatophora oceanica, Strain CCMP 410" /LENGTH=121 /DNA_ID=CAMNT_0038695491 /DNA_START=174 /DNA_END=540 /DNA_ORIENTATION=+